MARAMRPHPITSQTAKNIVPLPVRRTVIPYKMNSIPKTVSHKTEADIFSPQSIILKKNIVSIFNIVKRKPQKSF